MESRTDISEAVGVAQRPTHSKKSNDPLDKTRKPSFNWREDARHIGPLPGLFIAMTVSVFGALGLGKVLVYILGIISGQLPRTAEVWVEEQILGVFEPIFPLVLLWLFFDVRYHVKNGPGSFSTMSIFGIQFLKMRVFDKWLAAVFFGEVSCFKWIKVWRNDLGGTSITVEIPATFKAIDENGIPQPVSSKDGGNPKVEIFWAPLDPFKGVRRVDQGNKPNPGVIWSNTLSNAGSIFKQAASKSTLTMEKVLGSQDLNRAFMEALLGIVDDDPNGDEDKKVRYNSYWMLIGTRWEWVFETDDGIVLYNPRVTDMGPHPDVVDAMIKKATATILAQGDARALKEAQEAVKGSGEHADNALVLLGKLPKTIQTQRIEIDLPGLTGQEKVEAVRSVSAGATAVAAIFGGGRGGDKTKGGKKPEGQSGQKPKEESKGKDSPEGQKPRFTPRRKR